MTRRSIQRDGIKLSYDDHGSGPLVVLVQGLGMSAAMWMGLPFSLARRGLRVVVPDNRGAGASDTPPAPYHIHTMRDDLAQLIEVAGDGPAIVVGISLGGMVAQQLALSHPHLVRGLVLAATSCGTPRAHPSSPRVLAALVALLTDESSNRRALFELLVHGDSLAANPDLFAPWERTLESPQRPRRMGVTAQLAAAASHDTGARLGQIHCPTEVITGDSDRIVPAANAEILASAIPGARLTVVARAGHAFPMERPIVLPEAIQRLLAAGIDARDFTTESP